MLGLAQDEYRTTQQARINKQAAFLNMITTLATTGIGINQTDRVQTSKQPAFSTSLDLGTIIAAAI